MRRVIVMLGVALLLGGLLAPSAAAVQAAPGWYIPGAVGTSPFHIATVGSTVVEWHDSYVYPSPGDSRLYWYARVHYQNWGNEPVGLYCPGPGSDAPPVREIMRGTPNAGAVNAEETFCSRHPGWTGTLEKDQSHWDWAIFHNVPWADPTSELQLDWNLGLSAWHKPYALAAVGALPEDWPAELCGFNLCPPGARTGGLGYAGSDGQVAIRGGTPSPAPSAGSPARRRQLGHRRRSRACGATRPSPSSLAPGASRGCLSREASSFSCVVRWSAARPPSRRASAFRRAGYGCGSSGSRRRSRVAGERS